MNTKRALYQPANEDKSQIKNRRKPLVQGRLLQSRTASDATYTPLQYGEENAGSESGIATKDLRIHNITSDSPFQATGIETSTQSRPDTVQSDEQVSGADPSTPRKNRPHTSFTQSPRAVQPTRSLDISDSDSEIVFNYRNSRSLNLSPHKEVLYLDASQAARGPHDHEVPVELGYRQSPARVVCHSPGRAHGDLIGDSEQTGHIRVDQVPRISVLDSTHDSSVQHSKDERLFKTTQAVPVHAQGTAHVREPQQSMVKTLFHDDAGIENSLAEQSFPLSTNTEDVEAVRALETSEESIASQDQMSTHENKENLQQSKSVALSKAKTAQSANDNTTPKSTKKKKAPRFVASRYMQTQPAGRKPMKATDRSIMTRSNVSATSSATNTTRKVGGSVTLLQPRKTAPARSTSAKNKSALQKSSVSKTPETKKTSQPRGGKASTPTTESTTHVPEAVDLSAIGPPSHRHHSSFASPTLDESAFNMSGKVGARSRMGNSHMTSMNRNTTGSRRFDFNSTTSSQDSAYISKSKVKESHTSQLELDILYARYLQWVFLASSAKHSFQEQEKQFMNTMYELWQENDRLRQQESELKLKLGRLQHVNKLDEALETQESGLSAVCEPLPELHQQYSNMASALDTTRHQIPTRGVHIPDNEQYFQESLQHAIEESEQLLSELSVMTHSYTPAVHKMSQSLETMDRVAQTQVKELHRCGELLAAADSLSTRESSLKIQQLQHTSPS